MFSYNNPPNYIPIINEPFLYIVGLGLSNDATTPNNIMDIAVGQCRDSTDTFDINLGSPIKINITNKAAGGLDKGSVAANSLYAIVLISDPVSGNPTTAMFTLTPSAPQMPFGYSAWRVIGYAATDASSHILLGQWTAGGTGHRLFAYDIPQATSVTAGSSTTLAPVDLVTLVPSGIAELPVNLYFALTPGSIGNSFLVQGFNRSASGFATKVAGMVSGTQTLGVVQVIAEINAANGHPEINYLLTSNTDRIALSVAGYELNI
jgi:hypothetical protein